MWFSSRGHYGLRAMVHLGLAYGGGPVALAEIARKENLSADYLERLFVRLRKAGLVESTRGVRGGYRLTSKPAAITAGQILRALEGPVAPMFCASEDCSEIACEREQKCGSRLLWRRMRDSIAQVLDSTTLAELCGKSPAATLAMAAASADEPQGTPTYKSGKL